MHIMHPALQVWDARPSEGRSQNYTKKGVQTKVTRDGVWHVPSILDTGLWGYCPAPEKKMFICENDATLCMLWA